MTSHLADAEVKLDEREEQARRAVSAFRKLQPSLSSFARILTKDSRVSVQMRMTGMSSAFSDEKTVYMIPPMALGLKYDHQRKLCDVRDAGGEQQCEACAVHEEIMVRLYHEIAHIAFGTFAQPTEEDKKRLIREAVAATSGPYADRIRAKLESLPDYMTRSYLGLVGAVSEYLPLLLNGLEDARINEASFKARPGTRQMFIANTEKVFRDGIETRNPMTGQVTTDFWIDRPQNSQAIIGVFLKASGYPIEGKLIPPVVEALNDPEIVRLCNLVPTCRSVAGTYELSFPILARLRELGFCKAPDEEPLPDDPNEPDPDPGDGDKENEDEQDASSGGGDPEESEAPDDSGNESGDAGDPGNSSDDDSGSDGSDDAGAESEPDAGSDGASDTGADDSDGGVDDDEEAGSSSGESSEDGGESEPGESEADQEGNDDSESEDADGGSGEGSDSSKADGMDDSDPGEESSGESSDASGSSDPSESSPEPPSGNTSGDATDESSGYDSAGSPVQPSPESGSDESGASGYGSSDRDAGGVGLDEDSSLDSSDELDGDRESQPEDDDDSIQDERDKPGEGLDEASSGDPASQPTAGDDDLGGVRDDAQADKDERASDPSSPGGDDELFESGADEGLGGVQVEEDKAWDDHPMGTADDAEHDLESIEICGERPDSIMEGQPGDEQLIERAIIQGIYFERPSRNIFGVREHHYDKPLTDSDGNMLTRAWEKGRRMNGRTATRMGIKGEYEPTEPMLGPSLLRMRVAFSDNKRANMERHRKSGRVDARVLGKRAWQDDERLFKVKRLPGKRDYFVCIWLDISGSTAGTNIDLIKRAAFAQAELCQRMGITFAIYGGSGYYHDPSGGRGAGLDLDVYIIKEPDEPWSTKVQTRLSEIGSDAFNLDGHNMEYARHVCERRSETDKIVLYFSDGKMPAENHDEELEIMLREFREYKRKRITLLGVGIRTDSPARHGLDTVQIDSVEDLSKVVDQLGKYLTLKRV